MFFALSRRKRWLSANLLASAYAASRSAFSQLRMSGLSLESVGGSLFFNVSDKELSCIEYRFMQYIFLGSYGPGGKLGAL